MSSALRHSQTQCQAQEHKRGRVDDQPVYRSKTTKKPALRPFAAVLHDTKEIVLPKSEPEQERESKERHGGFESGRSWVSDV